MHKFINQNISPLLLAISKELHQVSVMYSRKKRHLEQKSNDMMILSKYKEFDIAGDKNKHIR